MSDALFAGQACGGALSGSPRALQHNLHIMTVIASARTKEALVCGSVMERIRLEFVSTRLSILQ